MGFPSGERYLGTPEQKGKVENQYLRKVKFMMQHGTPVWNGEFGPVYADGRSDADAEATNQCRYNLLGEQLRIYDKYGIHWSIWLYKDIGLQGMVHTNPQSRWNTTIRPLLDKKRRCWADSWGRQPSTEIDAILKPLVAFVDSITPAAGAMYPQTAGTQGHLVRRIFTTYLAESLSDEFANLFRGMDEKELDALAHSFHFDECVQREGLNHMLKEHARLSHK